MAARKVTFEFTGTSPLLMANGEAQEFTDGGVKGPKKKRSPKEEMEALCYREKDGSLYFLPQAFRESMLKACKGMKVGARGLEGVLLGCVFATDDRTPVLNPKSGRPIKAYEEFKSRVVNHNTNPPTALIAFRPMVREWKCVCTFDIDDEYVEDVGLILTLFDKAGRTVGVGAWRPEKRGRFGRYSVKLVNREKSDVWDKKPKKDAA